MGKLLDLDSPIMRFLSRVADLLWLNLLTLICSIPIITIGASFTALHHVCLKMVRGEEGYITKDYFKSFKENFLQSTVLWLIIFAIGALFAFDFWYMIYSGLVAEMKNKNVFTIALLCAALIYLCITVFVFPMQAHFVNPIKRTLKNSFLISMLVLPKTVLMILVWLVPLVIAYFVGQAGLLCFLLGISVPAYVDALLYNKTFKKFEPEKEELPDDFSWTVSEEGEDSGETQDALSTDNSTVVGETVTDGTEGTDERKED